MPCTLLLRVNGELKDVAKASIVTLLDRTMHTAVPLSDDVFRVAIARVLPGCAYYDLRLNPPTPKGSIISMNASRGR